MITKIVGNNNDEHRHEEVSVRIVIVAGGSGSRFGADLPKQFCDMAGRPVLMWTIDGFRRIFGEDAHIVLVLTEAMRPLWRQLCKEHSFASPEVVNGGVARWHSVNNALQAGTGHRGVTLVHDGARPIVDDAVVRAVVEAAVAHGACVPVVAVTDSLRLTDDTGLSHAVERARYRAVQTPQGFDSELLEHAYDQGYNAVFTDDASVVEAMGTTVALVDGNVDNIKITNPGDIDIAELYLQRRSRKKTL